MKKTEFAILGSGRVARHLGHYLKLLEIPYQTWSRNDGATSLENVTAAATHILLAVSDQAIASLAGQLPRHKTLVHFSGATTVSGVHAAHPLMTFADGLQDLAWYKRIPFALDEGKTLADVLPGLPNPWFTVKNGERVKYHALVAMAGNFAYLLWRNTVRELESSYAIGAKELAPYLQQVLNNFSADPENSLTGPIARKDWATIDRHLAVLHDAPNLRDLYLAFLNLAKEDLK